MPADKRVNVATATNAMSGRTFEWLTGPALISLWASCVTAGDTIGYKVGSDVFVDSAQPNIEASADVTDIDRDQILFQEPVPAGQQIVPITATTAVNFILNIEYA